MIKLKRMTVEDYATASEFYRSKEVKDMINDYYNYVYTASLDYIETGDLNILNSVMRCAKIMQRVRVTKQLLACVAAHNYNMNTLKFSGKANSKKLKTVRKFQPSVVAEKQEAIINQDRATKEARAATFDVDQTQTRAVNAIAALLAHHVDVDVVKLVALAKEKATDIKVKEVKAKATVVS